MISDNTPYKPPQAINSILKKIILEHSKLLDVDAIVLTGSFARGDYSKYSDVDITVFHKTLKQKSKNYILYYEGEYLVSLSKSTISEWEELMNNPEHIGSIYSAIFDSVILHDPETKFSNLKSKLPEHPWLDNEHEHQAIINDLAVGYIEEVHKLLSGIEEKNESTLINAVLGLVLGMAKIISIHNKLIFVTENEYFGKIQAKVGLTSTWTTLFRESLCLESEYSIFDKSKFAIELYRETIKMLNLTDENTKMINRTINLINNQIGV